MEFDMDVNTDVHICSICFENIKSKTWFHIYITICYNNKNPYLSII